MLDWYSFSNLTFIAKRLGIKVKALTAEHLYSLVKDRRITYDTIKEIEPKRF